MNIGVGRENLTEKHWIYYPEDTVFHRIFVQGNASPHCNPPGGFGLTCEITYGPLKPLPCDGDELIRLCIARLHPRRAASATDDPILARQPGGHALRLRGLRPRRGRRTSQPIRDWLAEHDILLAGRYSEWEYYNSDHAFLAGRTAAERARANQMLESQQSQETAS